jgi:hypothetical protein
MHSTSFDRPAGNYVARARFHGRMVRCIDTRPVPADCLGAAISAPRDLMGATQARCPTLESALRNRILAGDCARSGGSPLLLAHDTFFHWANCFGRSPPNQ